MPRATVRGMNFPFDAPRPAVRQPVPADLGHVARGRLDRRRDPLGIGEGGRGPAAEYRLTAVAVSGKRGAADDRSPRSLFTVHRLPLFSLSHVPLYCPRHRVGPGRRR